MNINKINVTVEVSNMSENALDKEGDLVVRRDNDSALWYYGLYSTEEIAWEVACEIGNGIVLEVKG